MTVIFATKFGSSAAIVTDNLITRANYDKVSDRVYHGRSLGKHYFALKSHILDKYQAIAFAGNVPAALRFIWNLKIELQLAGLLDLPTFPSNEEVFQVCGVCRKIILNFGDTEPFEAVLLIAGEDECRMFKIEVGEFSSKSSGIIVECDELWLGDETVVERLKFEVELKKRYYTPNYRANIYLKDSTEVLRLLTPIWKNLPLRKHTSITANIGVRADVIFRAIVENGNHYFEQLYHPEYQKCKAQVGYYGSNVSTYFEHQLPTDSEVLLNANETQLHRVLSAMKEGLQVHHHDTAALLFDFPVRLGYSDISGRIIYFQEHRARNSERESLFCDIHGRGLGLYIMHEQKGFIFSSNEKMGLGVLIEATSESKFKDIAVKKYGLNLE